VTAALAALSLAALAAAGPAPAAGEARPVLVLERTVTVYGLPPEPQKPAAPAPAGGEKPAAGEAKAEPAEPAKPAIGRVSEKSYRIRVAADRLRETCLDDGRVTVVRCDLGKLWVMDPAGKTFQEASFQEIDRQAEEARQRLVRRLPLIEDRALQARLRRLLGADAKPAQLVLEEGSEVRKVAGEDCRPLVARLDGEELFRGWLSARAVPLADRRWLMLAGCFPREIAEKLAAVRGLLMEATFPMPDGGRLELATRSVGEARPEPGEFDDPRELGYKDEAGRRASEPAKSDKSDRSEKPRPPAGSAKQP